MELAVCHFFIYVSAGFLSAVGNMNGAPGQYKISNGNPKASVNYSTDFRGEFFDVYSDPITTEYSQVYWRMQPPIALPADFVNLFKNKSVAITGYEMDIVRRTSSGDVPVPMNQVYNHHFEAYISSSAHVKMEKRHVKEAHCTSHSVNPVLVSYPEEDEPGASLVHCFYMGNGGEVRLSYHGFAQGYAQVLYSPDTFHVSPMIIDTKNRDQDGMAFKAGPLPRDAKAPRNATYSGLLECPCSTRLPKNWSMTYSLLSNGNCAEDVENASECSSAARILRPGFKHTDRVVSNVSFASACSIVEEDNGSIAAIWNTAGGTACDAKNTSYVGSASSLVHLNVSLDQSQATITIAGPATKWFGVGFGAESMCIHPYGDTCPGGGPYAIIVTGDGANVEERKLEDHGPGMVLQASIKIVSNTVVNGMRTVTLRRPLAGITEKHYTFDPAEQSLPFINAVGCGLQFAQHCGRLAGTLSLLALDRPTCVCRQGIKGTIGGNAFGPHCDALPASDLLATKNPTCFVETYQGGLQCCRDGQLLLDQDQPPPWPGKTLTYNMKFRFYFKEYNPAETQNTVWLVHIAQNEYDIVKCPSGTPPSECIQVNKARFKVSDMMHSCSSKGNFVCTGIGSNDPKITAGVKPILINPHCHAPTCLSMELYNADSGDLICGVQPIHGTGLELFNEKDYVNIPPCVWGDSPGLRQPPLLPLSTNLLAIKRCNSTYGHVGEMGHWQMRGVVVPRSQEAQLSRVDMLI